MVLLPKDYVRLRMTGDTRLRHVGQRGHAVARCGAAALVGGDARGHGSRTESHMPTLFEGNEITGELRAEVAEAWGMARVPVVAGGGDNAAGAIGVGVVRPGDAFLSLGTSGVLFLANDGYRPNPAGGVHTFCHAVPKHWHQMSVILSAASCVDWAARLCGLRRRPARCSQRPRRATSPATRKSSCPICRASARRTTIPTRRACCSA